MGGKIWDSLRHARPLFERSRQWLMIVDSKKKRTTQTQDFGLITQDFYIGPEASKIQSFLSTVPHLWTGKLIFFPGCIADLWHWEIKKKRKKWKKMWKNGKKKIHLGICHLSACTVDLWSDLGKILGNGLVFEVQKKKIMVWKEFYVHKNVFVES